MTKSICYDSHFTFGSGVDSSVEDIRGTAVIPTAPATLPGASGAEVTYMTKIVESQRDFEQSLGVSAAMSLNYGFVAGGNAKVDFAQSSTLNEYSLCILVSVQVKNPVLMMNGVRLTDEAKSLYAQNPEAFKQRFGDSYVNGVLTGGEMFGTIVIHTKSATEKSALAASLHASGHFGLTSATLDVSMHENVSNATKDSDTSVFVHTSGYTFEKYPQNPGELLDCAAVFPGKVKSSGQAMAYAMDLAEYKYLDLPAGPNLYDLQNRDDVIRYCSQLKSDALSWIATINYIRGNPQVYTDANAEKLHQYEVQLNALLDTIHGRVSSCFNDWRQCAFGRDDLVLPVMDLPQAVKPQITPIAAKYALTGGRNGFLGTQVTDEMPCMDGQGKYQKFQYGAIFWHQRFGAFEVHGTIYGRYKVLNCEQGALGYPTSDERSEANSVNRYNTFQNGSIHWDHATNVAKEQVNPRLSPVIFERPKLDMVRLTH